ncbi:MAG: deoxyhypusine synthase family protein [Bryobacterales bacterium]|nr:deoxyhypusine synthase family protein [Bryobacteraceae bacterium]MDW8355686.1 deoxyhypusine synthase family protein [Bryobacterales bacterium]
MKIAHAPKAKEQILSVPTRPFDPAGASSLSEVLTRMQGTAFQGRQLGLAFEVWKKMLTERCTIWLGLSGAMVPAGMRKLVVAMIRHRLVDCIVSTGANFFHDFHETLGYAHYQGSPHMDDVELAENLVDRMYDVLADEEKFREHDLWIGRFAASLDQSRPYTTREFLYLLGLELSQWAKEEGILTAAAKAGVPLYCPAIADSSIGIGIAENRHIGGNRFVFDVIGDVLETAHICAGSPVTGVVYFGGGTPKNFIQQTEVTNMVMKAGASGHKYAVQVVTDAPHWGGLSGCTFEEAQSWGKIAKDAQMVTCHADSTIAMPLLVTALLEQKELLAKRRPPRFSMGRELEITI